MAYIGNSPGVSSQRIVNTFTATAGQTTFTPSSGYTVGYVDVYLNGIKLVNGTDYTASNGSTVVFTETAAADDVVEVMAYIPRGMSDGYTKSEADTRYVNSTGDSITGNLSFGDNDKAIFGAGSDLQIYHDGSHSRIVDSGTGHLIIQATDLVIQDGASTEQMGKFTANGAALLNYDGSTKLATTSTGVSVTGTVAATAFTGDGSALTGIDSLPTQSGQSGKFLTTDGTNADWATVDLTQFDAPVQFKNYTTTARNALTGLSPGDTIYNSTTGSIEFYDGTNWIATNLTPSINSISGTIYSGVSTTLTLSITNATDTVDVKYYEGSTLLATDSAVTVTSGSASSTVPSAVYGQSAGDIISIQIFNLDGTPSSNSVTKTLQGLPTGGTITTFGSYRVHAFTSSGTFTVPSGLSITADTLVTAGGGAGGQHNTTSNYGGAGGAGGLIYDTGRSVTAAAYTVTVGAGGSGPDSGDRGNNGSNTTIFGLTAIGGGGGGHQTLINAGKSGGSGGGGSYPSVGSATGGAGTSGQGNAGAIGTHGGTSPSGPNASGGGGGAGSAGTPGTFSTPPHGGAGLNMSAYFGTAYGESGWFAGGGAGTNQQGYSTATGGQGGGGDGGNYNNSLATNGTANTGGGGGGGSSQQSGRSGGSGIVVIRYLIP
jgi:hypothetical protein